MDFCLFVLYEFLNSRTDYDKSWYRGILDPWAEDRLSQKVIGPTRRATQTDILKFTMAIFFLT